MNENLETSGTPSEEIDPLTGTSSFGFAGASLAVRDAWNSYILNVRDEGPQSFFILGGIAAILGIVGGALSLAGAIRGGREQPQSQVCRVSLRNLTQHPIVMAQVLAGTNLVGSAPVILPGESEEGNYEIPPGSTNTLGFSLMGRNNIRVQCNLFIENYGAASCIRVSRVQWQGTTIAPDPRLRENHTSVHHIFHRFSAGNNQLFTVATNAITHISDSKLEVVFLSS